MKAFLMEEWRLTHLWRHAEAGSGSVSRWGWWTLVLAETGSHWHLGSERPGQ